MAFALKRGVKIQELEQALRLSIVGAAVNELRLRQHEVSASRLSVMTGLRRPEAQRLFETLEAHVEPNLSSPSLTRIVRLWEVDRRFVDEGGEPRPLTFSGKRSEFARLVKAVSEDLSHHTILFELERLGMVERRGRLAQLRAREVQDQSFEAGLRMLGQDLSTLIRAVDYNLSNPGDPPQLHARTWFDNVPTELLPRLKKLLLRFGQRVHSRARPQLGQFDRDENPSLTKLQGRARVSLLTVAVAEECPGGSQRDQDDWET